jgi:DNA repair exonuclease SbcCD nuclease subunit|tara:strand:- start:153 stop:1199 length:1047 start_codon:yes stop_codon:yes gene_type:complete
MKVAIITDQHFGARKSSRVFHDFFKKFYDNIFFPTIKKRGIDTVLDLGDTFDNRRNLDLWAAQWSTDNYFSRLKDMGVTIHSLVGNHTAYFKDTNKVNTLESVLGEYDNIKIYDKATEVMIGGLPILFIPWINSENSDETYALIEKSECPIAMGHLELNGFEAHRGYIMDHGHATSPYKKFDKVFSGHYHQKSTRENITYLGNPYQIYWNDYNQNRGFHIFDTNTKKLEFIENPYQIYQKIYYNEDQIKSGLFKFHEYNQSFIKIIVERKTDTDKFERFISQLYAAGVHEIKVIEDPSFEQDLNEEIDIEKEDTLTILEKYVDDMEHSNKPALKSILKSLYVEALELV